MLCTHGGAALHARPVPALQPGAGRAAAGAALLHGLRGAALPRHQLTLPPRHLPAHRGRHLRALLLRQRHAHLLVPHLGTAAQQSAGVLNTIRTSAVKRSIGSTTGCTITGPSPG